MQKEKQSFSFGQRSVWMWCLELWQASCYWPEDETSAKDGKEPKRTEWLMARGTSERASCLLASCEMPLIHFLIISAGGNQCSCRVLLKAWQPFLEEVTSER